MALSPEEKAVIKEALQVYIQIGTRQMPKQQLQQLFQIVEGIVKKIDAIGSDNRKGNKSAGITDEWYNKVCKTCDKLSSTGCIEKVTEKFPGKCDPILHYEREKQKS